MDEMTGLSLETSAVCQLRCPHCFLRSFQQRPGPGVMPLTVVEAVAPFLSGLEAVDLTGWGEPLLHPHLLDLIALIRKSFKGRLTMTTNGLLLTSAVMDRLIALDLDTVCISLDAAGPESYARARPGGDFHALVAALREFVQRRPAGRPLLFATFLLRQEALPELSAFISMMADLGLDGAVLQQLTGVFSRGGLAQVTHRAYYGNAFDEDRLTQAVATARNAAPAGFIIVGPEAVLPHRLGDCGGFDLSRPFITASGQVSACCAMAYPCALLRRDGKVEETKSLTFGNVRATPLPEIWRHPAYVRAREEIRSGVVPAACGDCIALYLRRGEVWTASQKKEKEKP
jgi:MoaA/NifB/PqqE/SkfB family radical SAM enzyme